MRDCRHKLIMPGLVNSHLHFYHTMHRGLAPEDLGGLLWSNYRARQGRDQPHRRGRDLRRPDHPARNAEVRHARRSWKRALTIPRPRSRACQPHRHARADGPALVRSGDPRPRHADGGHRHLPAREREVPEELSRRLQRRPAQGVRRHRGPGPLHRPALSANRRRWPTTTARSSTCTSPPCRRR